ncbi:hypothetical protein [uncultured Nocardioides sp.]|uniref:hypothetical protein n=1 Tax=uncultured Nocardioides sp. TaxID=198441 RepID=UPI002630EBB2|nr:hypothetical protein [uncultured Nocardioides sp.]
MPEVPTLPWGPALRQPDRFTCGPACVVVARMLDDPAYAARALPRFGPEVLETHRQVTAWPRLLGTPPWEVARLLPGRHRVVPARHDPGAGWDGASVGSALFVGSATLPRHVVLVLAADGDDRELYDPAHGGRVRRTRAQAAGHTLGLSGWDHLWAVVAPR